MFNLKGKHQRNCDLKYIGQYQIKKTTTRRVEFIVFFLSNTNRTNPTKDSNEWSFIPLQIQQISNAAAYGLLRHEGPLSINVLLCLTRAKQMHRLIVRPYVFASF